MEEIAVVNVILLIAGVLVLLGIASSLIATRFGAPLLLVFLVLGMLAGEDGPGQIAFSDYRLTYLIGSLALAIILFDGGLRTNLTKLRGAVAPAIVMATVGVLATAGAAQLDGLFAEHTELLTTDEPFFGEFLFAGTVPLQQLAGFYALKLGPAMGAMTIAALFASRLDDAPEVGDHLPLGTAVIVAREVSDGLVTRAGLQLAATPEDAAVSTVRAVFVKLRRILGLR